MATKSLKTQWGSKKSNHASIITKPPSKTTDLTLTSTVLVQGFWSLQQHEYQYIAENSSPANFRVEWVGPKVTWGSLPPQKIIQRRNSFFSPRQLNASVDADVFASAKVQGYRQVRGETARAYVPWKDGDWKDIWETVKGVKDLLGMALPIFSFASVETPNGMLGVISSIQQVKTKLFYKLQFINSSSIVMRCEIPGITSGFENVEAALDSGNTIEWNFESSDPPGEAEILFRFKNLEQADSENSSFPLGILTPYSLAKDWITVEIELAESTR